MSDSWFLISNGEACRSVCAVNTGDQLNCNVGPENDLQAAVDLRSVGQYLGIGDAQSLRILSPNAGTFNPGQYQPIAGGQRYLVPNAGRTSNCAASNSQFERFCCCSTNDAECPLNPYVF